MMRRVDGVGAVPTSMSIGRAQRRFTRHKTGIKQGELKSSVRARDAHRSLRCGTFAGKCYPAVPLRCVLAVHDVNRGSQAAHALHHLAEEASVLLYTSFMPADESVTRGVSPRGSAH